MELIDYCRALTIIGAVVAGVFVWIFDMHTGHKTAGGAMIGGLTAWAGVMIYQIAINAPAGPAVPYAHLGVLSLEAGLIRYVRSIDKLIHASEDDMYELQSSFDHLHARLFACEAKELKVTQDQSKQGGG